MEDEIVNKAVEWSVMGITIDGTLTVPKRSAVRSAVVFVAGSGPTDRDWCSPLLPGTNGSAKLLAEALARNGLATIRYNKMASGPHVRGNLPKFAGKASMQTHLEELKGAVITLEEEMNGNIQDVFALTNSEGAIHAVNYQLQSGNSERFKGMVLTGAPGRAVGEVARSQLVAQSKSYPGAEEVLRHYDSAVAEFLAGRAVVPDPSMPEIVKLLLQSLTSPSNLPFSRELWTYSLPEHLKKVEVPILTVIGKKDIQVDWRVDGSAIEGAMAGKDGASFSYPENANHVLKHEELPLEKLTLQYVAEHYNAPDAVLDEETLRSILEWLGDQAQP